MLDLLFESKENRDLKFKELKNSGRLVKKSTVRHQQLHPMYVEDLKQNLRKEDCGFGNTLYTTWFEVLYTIKFLD